MAQKNFSISQFMTMVLDSDRKSAMKDPDDALSRVTIHIETAKVDGICES